MSTNFTQNYQLSLTTNFRLTMLLSCFFCKIGTFMLQKKIDFLLHYLGGYKPKRPELLLKLLYKDALLLLGWFTFSSGQLRPLNQMF